MERIDAERAVLSRGWLAEEDVAFRALLLEAASLRRFAQDAPVFRAGDEGGGVYGVAEGGFGVFVPRRDAPNRLAHVARRGDWFGYGPVMTRRRRTLGFAALEPSVALHVPLAALERIGQSDGRWRLSLARLSEGGMDVAIETIATLLIPDSEARIAATLLRIAPKPAPGETAAPAVTGVTQAQLGEMANASREVVNRTLGRFEKRGWIASAYRRIELRDAPALEALCAAFME